MDLRERILSTYDKEDATREQVAKKPDMTLAELREAVGLDCTLPAIHYVLEAMGLSYKKRLSMPASKSVKTSRRPGRGGAAIKGA